MCMGIHRSEIRRFGKDTELWKLLVRAYRLTRTSRYESYKRTSEIYLRFVHCGTEITDNCFKANKPFTTRYGYMCFESYEEAVEYRKALAKVNRWRAEKATESYPIKRAVVKRGTHYQRGVIASSYVGYGKPCIRVSSIEKLEEEPREKETTA